MKLGKFLEKYRNKLDSFEAEVLLSHVLELSRTKIMVFPEFELSKQHLQEIEQLFERRIAGEPIAYLLGTKEFWSLDFVVTPDVLIPRPDSELMVELVLELTAANSSARLLDLGTGSGALALSIAHERPGLDIIATDKSKAALQIAQLNSNNLQLSNVSFYLGDWYAALGAREQFDYIIANPPYIAEFDEHLEQGDLRFEPQTALVAADEGMADLATIISGASKYLVKGGRLLLEHGYNQEHLVAKLLAQYNFADIICHRDLGGNPRVSTGVML